LEFEVKSSPSILFGYISSPSGLGEWFAKDVNVQNGKFKFTWDDSDSVAQIVKVIANKSIRFKWQDAPQDEYLEFEIVQDELTNDVAIIITDFVDDKEIKEATMLWETQVQDLKAALGG
jgi:uncharacterized protein YndB with AHSA1/START domain